MMRRRGASSAKWGKKEEKEIATETQLLARRGRVLGEKNPEDLLSRSEGMMWGGSGQDSILSISHSLTGVISLVLIESIQPTLSGANARIPKVLLRLTSHKKTFCTQRFQALIETCVTPKRHAHNRARDYRIDSMKFIHIERIQYKHKTGHSANRAL